MRRFAFVTGFIVVSLFALPIVGGVLAMVFGRPLNNLLAILLVTVAWYAAVLVVMRLIARRAKKRRSDQSPEIVEVGR